MSGGGTILDDCKGVTFGFEASLPSSAIRPRKKGKEICQNYQKGVCPLGKECPQRHIITNLRTVQQVVCKHWLRDACVKGEDCEFIHEFNDRLIEECAFYNRFGQCTNPECVFRHVHPDDKVSKCAAYERGFCPSGPNCELRHVKQAQVCPFYMSGFCPRGAECTEGGHPSTRLHDRATEQSRVREILTAEKALSGGDASFKPALTCFKCFDPGHRAPDCPGIANGRLFRSLMQVREPGEKPFFLPNGHSAGQFCFFCGDESHIISKCPYKDYKDGGAPQQQQQQYGGGGYNNNQGGQQQQGGGGGGGYGGQQQSYQQPAQRY